MNEIKKVLICGIGAIGSILAHKISKFDNENLKILVDKNRLNSYTKSPKIFNGEELNLNYITPENTDFKADLIIIATKFNALNDVVKNIENFVDENTIIMSILNGISSEEILAGSNPVIRTKKVVSEDTTFFIHYGVMVYHHATCLRAYHQKERFFRSFLHIITLFRVLKLRNDDIQCFALMIYSHFVSDDIHFLRK